MSVWLTKSSGRDRDYIVLKHSLRGVNYVMNGVKFRNGYAVVEKNSKTYHDLKKIPVLKSAQEFPLIFLNKLPFITRPLDVKLVYGADVYTQFLKQLDAEIEKSKEIEVEKAEKVRAEEEIKHVEEHKLCARRTVSSGDRDLCKEDALPHSPSGYCLRHILEDPKLEEFGIVIPKFVPKKDKWALRDRISKQLADLKKEGKF